MESHNIWVYYKCNTAKYTNKLKLKMVMGMREEILNIVQANFTIYIICLLALLACLYTINSVADYQQQINNNWEQQWEASGCQAAYIVPNISYKYMGGYYEIDGEG